MNIESPVGQDFEGKWVLLHADILREEFRTMKHRIRLATGGFGCNPKCIGRAVFTADPLDRDNQKEWERYERRDIEGILDEAEALEVLGVAYAN